MPSAEQGERQDDARAPIVVVGVDGSDASRDALRWAASYAQLIGAHLRAVTAWQWPLSMTVALPVPEDFDPAADALKALDGILSETLGDHPAISISSRVYDGPAAAALVDDAADADLLVVGSRGRGGFAGLLLGSTSEHCARHAACPVVIVRHAAERNE